MIAVADDGIGMDKPTIERACEPFFTTKETGKGTGLGLSQVYGFVRQSSGNVKIYSELGEGTTVKIYLPRYLGADEHEDQGDAKREIPGATGGETILVVEDDEALRAYTFEVLTDFGYRVFGAPIAAAALQILDREEDIDLLFTDVVIAGGMNGRQLAEQAMKRRPDLKVLFTTGFTRNAIIHKGTLDADTHFIAKPFTLEDLARKVREALGR